MVKLKMKNTLVKYPIFIWIIAIIAVFFIFNFSHAEASTQVLWSGWSNYSAALMTFIDSGRSANIYIKKWTPETLSQIRFPIGKTNPAPDATLGISIYQSNGTATSTLANWTVSANDLTVQMVDMFWALNITPIADTQTYPIHIELFSGSTIGKSYVIGAWTYNTNNIDYGLWGMSDYYTQGNAYIELTYPENATSGYQNFSYWLGNYSTENNILQKLAIRLGTSPTNWIATSTSYILGATASTTFAVLNSNLFSANTTYYATPYILDGITDEILATGSQIIFSTPTNLLPYSYQNNPQITEAISEASEIASSTDPSGLFYVDCSAYSTWSGDGIACAFKKGGMGLLGLLFDSSIFGEVINNFGLSVLNDMENTFPFSVFYTIKNGLSEQLAIEETTAPDNNGDLIFTMHITSSTTPEVITVFASTTLATEFGATWTLIYNIGVAVLWLGAGMATLALIL